MEKQVTPLFDSILTIIKQYEKNSTEHSAQYEKSLKEKDTQIHILHELKEKLQS